MVSNPFIGGPAYEPCHQPLTTPSIQATCEAAATLVKGKWRKALDAPAVLLAGNATYNIWLVVSTPLKILVSWDDYSQYMEK